MAGGFGFQFDGWEKAKREFVRMGVQADAIARDNVRDLAAILIKKAQQNFQDGAKGDIHASGGEKPFAITGNLRRSIQAQGGIRAVGPGIYSTTVGPTAKYGRRVELGYKNMNRPFPYFGPAAKVARAEGDRVATENWLAMWKG